MTLLATSPSAAASDALLAVDRAIGDLRRGGAIAIRGPRGAAALALAAEMATPDSLALMRRQAGSAPVLALTARRAAALRPGQPGPRGAGIHSIMLPNSADADLVRRLADPIVLESGAAVPDIAGLDIEGLAVVAEPPEGCAAAAVDLTKRARLLPAALVALIDLREPEDLGHWARVNGLLLAAAADIAAYPRLAAAALEQVGEARVPLDGAENTRIAAFRPRDGGLEHLAVLIGDPPRDAPVLTRLHSQCFTGDLIGSLRCDCGEQLRGAIAALAAAGGGVLLYLAQEGRDIGLVNKLRAYELQDRGFDTMDANEVLGFDADERVYLPAAAMLRLLGIARVRLLTNNPAKVAALAHCGIEVTERVPHVFPANPHNADYLRAKAARGGHLF